MEDTFGFSLNNLVLLSKVEGFSFSNSPAHFPCLTKVQVLTACFPIRIPFQKDISIIAAETVKQAYFSAQLSLKRHKLVELMNPFEKIWKPQLKDFKNYGTTIKYTKLFLASELYISVYFWLFFIEFRIYQLNSKYLRDSFYFSHILFIYRKIYANQLICNRRFLKNFFYT